MIGMTMLRTTSQVFACLAEWHGAEGARPPLKEELDRYAAEHSKLYEPVETAALIPHMLEAFIRTDRGWRSRRKQMEQMQTGQRRTNPTSGTTRADWESSS